MRSFVIVTFFACLAPYPATAAMLRPMTVLAAPVVRLSDLFDDAGEQAGRLLGPAPPPGQSVTVPAPQLAAIARQFGVDWQPASPADRAVLQRRGVALPREPVLAALRAALDGAGAGEGDLDLPGFDAPTVPPEADAKPLVEQFDYDAASGRFTAALVIEGREMAPIRLRLSGRLAETQAVLVAAHRLPAGVPITAADLRPARLRTAAIGGEVVREAAQADGLAPRRPLLAGQPVALVDLAPPVVVGRGAQVAVALLAPGITLASTGRALDAGAVGARVRVENPVSRAVLLAEVTGPNAVRVEPGSLPLRPGADPGQLQAAAPSALP